MDRFVPHPRQDTLVRKLRGLIRMTGTHQPSPPPGVQALDLWGTERLINEPLSLLLKGPSLTPDTAPTESGAAYLQLWANPCSKQTIIEREELLRLPKC